MDIHNIGRILAAAVGIAWIWLPNFHVMCASKKKFNHEGHEGHEGHEEARNLVRIGEMGACIFGK
jgi:hypothetical protein